MEIKTITTRVRKVSDVGYNVYIAFLKSLNGKAPPYGSRNNSVVEAEVQLHAETENGNEEDIANLIRSTIDAVDSAIRIETVKEDKEDMVVVDTSAVDAPAMDFK